jgi:hypothetical protein
MAVFVSGQLGSICLWATWEQRQRKKGGEGQQSSGQKRQIGGRGRAHQSSTVHSIKSSQCTTESATAFDLSPLWLLIRLIQRLVASNPAAAQSPVPPTLLCKLALTVLATIADGQLRSAGFPSTIAAQPGSAAVVAAAQRDCVSLLTAAQPADVGADAASLSEARKQAGNLCQIIYSVAWSSEGDEQQQRVQAAVDLGVPQMPQQLLDGGAALTDDCRAAAAFALFVLAIFEMAAETGASAGWAAAALCHAAGHLAAAGYRGLVKASYIALIVPNQLQLLAAASSLLTAAAREAVEGGEWSAVAMQLLYRLATLVEQLPLPAYAPAGGRCGHPGCAPTPERIAEHRANCEGAYLPPNPAAAYQAALVPLRALARTADPLVKREAQAALAAVEQIVAAGPSQQQQQQQHSGAPAAAPAAEQPLRACASCGKTAAEQGVKLRHCTGCHARWFCSPECQRADWKSPTGHKAACKAAQAAAKAKGKR